MFQSNTGHALRAGPSTVPPVSNTMTPPSVSERLPKPVTSLGHTSSSSMTTVRTALSKVRVSVIKVPACSDTQTFRVPGEVKRS